MRIIKVKLKKRSYEIAVGSGIIGRLGRYLKKLNLGSDAYVITNAPIKKRYGAGLEGILKESGFSVKYALIPDTERSKSIERSAIVVQDIAAYDHKKRLFIVAFGGGVVGDLAGFVASIYKRGISFVQIPTTLLAQVDSAIGGKTAVDLSQGKNLVGAIYQPRLVFSEVKYLASLGGRELRSGIAEVIKYALIKDSRLFAYLEKNLKNIFHFNPAALRYIVERSSQIKAGIVSRDEKEERGLRTLLNFGHTIGHAIETAGNYLRYAHGEAIALGMIAASDISREMGLIDSLLFKRIESLITKAGLPVRLKKVSLGAIIQAHYRDKKFKGESNRFVLLEGIGKAKVKQNIPAKVIRQVLERLREK